MNIPPIRETIASVLGGSRSRRIAVELVQRHYADKISLDQAYELIGSIESDARLELKTGELRQEFDKALEEVAASHSIVAGR